MTTTFSRMQIMYGTTALWTANSTFVGIQGELMVDIDTGQLKIGNGFSTYSALPFVGAGLGVTFANNAQVLAGLLGNVAVAPDTLLANYPQKAAGAVAQSISADWTFNGANTLAGRTTVSLQPRTDGTGVNDAMPRSYIDNLFSGQVSGGASDAGKAPILSSSGQLDTSFIPTENLPGFKGLFNPVTGSPQLENVTGGGTSPASISGDYYIADDTGFYNFTTGSPGAGTSVAEGAQIIFNATTNIWSVINPSGTNFDPGAVRKAPASAAEAQIIPGGVGVPNLTLQQIASQTAAMIRFLDSTGVQIGAFDVGGTLTTTSIAVPLVAPATTVAASGYPTGITYSAVLAANSWPIDGAALTFKESDTSAYQLVANATGFYVRQFTGGAWTGFAQLAPTESPTFTGTVTIPTPPAATDNQQAASTAFVVTELEDPGLTQCRLSLASGAFIFIGADAASGTLFFNPYRGNKITLYDTTRQSWVKREFPIISVTSLGAANSVNDVFAYWTGSAVALELIAWTNNTTRTTDIVLQDGVYVKDGDASRKYIGTYRLDGSSLINTTASAIKDISVAANREWSWLLYNYYNQVDHKIVIKMTNAGNLSSGATNTTWQSLFNLNSQFLVLNGQEHFYSMNHLATFQNGDGRASWAFDSGTALPNALPDITIAAHVSSSAQEVATVSAKAEGFMSLGFHSYAPSVLVASGASVNYFWQGAAPLGNNNIGSYAIANIKA